MRPLSQSLLLLIPAFLVLTLLLLFSAPLRVGGLSLAPNVVLLSTLILSAAAPQAWTKLMVFVFGLLQDMLYNTPLGSQALLALLLAAMVERQANRRSGQTFLLGWLEAAGTLVMWHFLLWLVLMLVSPQSAEPLRPLLRAGLSSALWYPVFHAGLTGLCRLLPER